MTADQYLGQLRIIRRRIECKQKEAQMWHDIAVGSSQGNEGDRVQSSANQDRMADAVAKAMDYEREAQALTWRLIDLQHDIICKLDHMPTDDYGILLSDYYVHDMSLAQIAAEWNFSHRHIKRMKCDAVKEFGRIYGIEA